MVVDFALAFSSRILGENVVNEWNSKANELFADAIRLGSLDRQAFLIRECGDETDLRTAVEYLLDAHARVAFWKIRLTD